MNEKSEEEPFPHLSDNPAVDAAFHALSCVLDRERMALGRNLFAEDRILRASECVARLAETEQREFEEINR